MYVRKSVIRRNGKTYEYLQLVESYRTKSGSPTNRVIANVSKWSPLQIQNLSRGIEAARQGKTVIIEPAGQEPPEVEILRSLDYLDIAVVLDLWKRCELNRICGGLLDSDDFTVAPADIVAALVVQRIVAPDSKLAAARWFPYTALPELLGVPVGAFNNSRIHRTLEALDGVDQELQEQIARSCARGGAFATLYLDATDTFFVGRGPNKASNGKTKEGRVERKVGVLLLCNERGEPLRWEVVEGRSPDNLLFRDMFTELQNLGWAAQVPIVVDRAMGHTADIRVMSDSGLRFLTALTASEFDSYTDAIPRTAIGALELELNDPPNDKNDLALLAKTVSSHGFERVHDDLYILELGVREAGDAASNADLQAMGDMLVLDARSSRAALELGRQLRDKLDSGLLRGIRGAAKHYGRGKTWVHRRLLLAQLPASIQRDIDDGNAEHVALKQLAALTRLPAERQQAAYDELVRTALPGNKSKGSGRSSANKPEVSPLLVRQVLYFRPSLHLQKRHSLQERLAEVYTFTRALNDDIAKRRTRRSAERLRARVEQYLVDRGLRSAFQVDITARGTIELKEDSAHLCHRRGRFGFSFLVAHPELTEPAEDLVHLYRAKNEVERDFRVIKSVLELRPINHRTDAKVAAHVTLCMLALLLLRTLDADLASSNISASMALETLATCKLNQLGTQGDTFYLTTRANNDQRNLLKSLNLEHLIDIHQMRGEITHR